jgi:fatty-acyl-CoA synthase
VDRQAVSADINAAIKTAIALGSLSKWAMPDEIRFVDQIAKTSVGKIDKKAIRAALL